MERRPVLVVDIDNTILDPSRRKARAFIDAVKSMRTSIDPKTVKKINDASRTSFDFSPMKKIVDKELDDRVFRRFLSNNYLVMNGRVMDDPVPGAVKFLNDAVKNGCDIVYITGRSTDEWQDPRKSTSRFSGLVRGTLASIERSGFPVPSYPPGKNDRVQIVFKDKRTRKDEEYKPAEIRKLQSRSNVAIIIDDNKKVMDEFKKSFPGISRIAVLLYPEMKPNDFGCIHKSQKKITEFIGGTPPRGGTECIEDFTRVKSSSGCVITVNGRRIT